MLAHMIAFVLGSFVVEVIPAFDIILPEYYEFPKFDFFHLEQSGQMCPTSVFYGAELKRFFASPVYAFSSENRNGINGTDGKMWQLRTVAVQGQYRVLPFIINTGGATYYLAYGHDVALRLFSPRFNRTTFSMHPAMPTPLGEIAFGAPWSTWGQGLEKVFAHQSWSRQLTLNLLGQGLAHAIIHIDSEAFQVRDHGLRECYFESFRKRFSNITTEALDIRYVKLELMSMLEVDPTWSWTNYLLPVPCDLFKNDRLARICKNRRMKQLSALSVTQHKG